MTEKWVEAVACGGVKVALAWPIPFEAGACDASTPGTEQRRRRRDHRRRERYRPRDGKAVCRVRDETRARRSEPGRARPGRLAATRRRARHRADGCQRD